MKSNRNLAIVTFVLVVVALASPAAAQQVLLDPTGIPQFVNELPMLGPTGLPVLDSRNPATAEKFISICEFQTQILPTGTVDTVTGNPVPTDTWVWGYQMGQECGLNPGHSYIGPVVVANRGTPTQLTFINRLGEAPLSNVLAYSQNTDQTMHWADPINGETNNCAHQADLGYMPQGECLLNYSGPIAAAVHLHGGEVPPELDGGPDSWFSGVPDPANAGAYYRGHGYYTREVTELPTLPHVDYLPGVMIFNQDVPGDGATAGYYRNDADTWTPTTEVDRATFVYPNEQEAANIWFHDHILGMTRLNVYAGIAGAYVIEDPGATNPDLGAVTDLVPLVIQDRTFDTDGQLWFGEGGATPEHPYWVPEFIGDVIVVNGAAWPKMVVEPKRYRFLFLNGSNARGYDIFLQVAPAGVKPNGKPSKPKYGPPIHVIGTDGGYLDAPATVNPRNSSKGNPAKLVLLPGERYEVIIDFTQFAGQTMTMMNTAGTPYPLGDPVVAGLTDTIMQFQVTNAVTSPGIVYNPDLYDPADPTTSPRVDPIIRLAPLAAAPDVYRQLTLNEVEGLLAPREALLNNTKWHGKQIVEGGGTTHPNAIQNRADFTEVDYNGVPTWYSEHPGEGTFEIWEIINITADAHPIHLHLVQFQLLGRQPIDDVQYFAAYESLFPGSVYLPGYGPPMNYNMPNGDGAIGGNPAPSPYFIAASLFGPARGPEPFEYGWKDTVTAYPGEVTRIAVRWMPTDTPLANTEGYPFDPDEGHGYVWHCHILDHEDNEMMRPTQVVPGAFVRSFEKATDY